jgi:amino acid transporter
LHTRTPAWVILGLIFSLLIGLLVALSVRKTVAGRLPGCAVCISDRRRYRLQRAGAWTVALLVAAGTVVADSAALALLMLVVTVGALLFSFSGDYFRVRGTLSSDQYWVELKGASEHFARQIDQALHAAAQPVHRAHAQTSTGWVTANPGYYPPR